eukprot:TRINITY_DN3605_c0_g1_i7.p1 TRINITY_DN3605_c0_g1~~TRINITY_DN3605_c0_g1_i7.p1  ORF type:complete len:817 (+),score=223.81 TRINITY_DN3605_c0_g1_i7:57-2507(+)
MDKFPVVLRCEDTYVTVPIRTLIKESIFFKSMLQHSHGAVVVQPSGQSDDEKSEDSSESEDDKEDENARSKAVTIPSALSTVTTSPTITRTTPAPLAVEAHAEIIPLVGYNQKAVKVIFDFLSGYTEMLEASTAGLTVLGDMLRLCNDFGMQSPVMNIIQRIEQTNITIDNLVEAVTEAEKLETICQFKMLAQDVFQRCVAFARSNFASWQVVVAFILKNRGRIDCAVKLCRALKNDYGAVIRRTVDASKLTLAEQGPSYIIKNLEWKILCQQTKMNGVSYLGVYVSVQNPHAVSDSWSCSAQMELRLYSHKQGSSYYSQMFDATFCSTKGVKGMITEGIEYFKIWDEVMDKEKGFCQDGKLILEAKIEVTSVAGTQEFNRHTEESIAWFPDVLTAEQKEETDKREVDVDEASDESPAKRLKTDFGQQDESSDNKLIVLMCDNVAVIIEKALLVKKSKFFKARFSKNWKSGSAETSVSVKAGLPRTGQSDLVPFPVSGYNAEAIKILVEYLKGYPAMMDKCDNFSELGDMLRFCDYYDIPDPVSLLKEKIDQLSITLANLVDAFETSQSLLPIASLSQLVEHLHGRTIAYAAGNLASWQALNSLVVENAGSSKHMDTVVNILQILGEEQACVLRFRFDNVSKMNRGYPSTSLTLIKKNLCWKIKIERKMVDNQEYLSAYLSREPTSHEKSDSGCTVKNLEIRLYKENEDKAATEQDEVSSQDVAADTAPAPHKCYHYKWESDRAFDQEPGAAAGAGGNLLDGGWDQFLLWSEVIKPDNGFLKDDSILVEARFEVMDPSGIPDSLNVLEESIRWVFC